MIIYSSTRSEFIDDIVNGVLDEKLESLMKERFGRGAPESELRAWRNSLTYMGNIIGSSSIPADAGIAIEYGIPYTSKRVDLIVTGLNESGRNAAVIVELKQWSSAEAVPGKDGVVRTAPSSEEGSTRWRTHHTRHGHTQRRSRTSTPTYATKGSYCPPAPASTTTFQRSRIH